MVERPLDDGPGRFPADHATQRLELLHRDSGQFSTGAAGGKRKRLLPFQRDGVGDQSPTRGQHTQAELKYVGSDPAADENRVRGRQAGQQGPDVPLHDLDLTRGAEAGGIGPGSGSSLGSLLDPDRPRQRIDASGAYPLDGDRTGSGAQIPHQVPRAGTQVGQGGGADGPLGDQPVVLEHLIREAGTPAEDITGGVADHAASLPTTRQARRTPLLVVHTGDGKGKTTAAMGLVLRAWAQGWSVAVVQFVKSGRWPVGEKRALAELDRIYRESGQGGPIAWYQAGTGWSWSAPQTRSDDQGVPVGRHEAAEAASTGWRTVVDLLSQQRHDLYVLDELTHAIRQGWLEEDEVRERLTTRPGHQHVVVTGRGCPASLREAADLVTEMVPVAHPFERGQRGQAGIEW